MYFSLSLCGFALARHGRGASVGGQWEGHLWLHPVEIQRAKRTQSVKGRDTSFCSRNNDSAANEAEKRVHMKLVCLSFDVFCCFVFLKLFLGKSVNEYWWGVVNTIWVNEEKKYCQGRIFTLFYLFHDHTWHLYIIFWQITQTKKVYLLVTLLVSIQLNMNEWISRKGA